MQSRLVALQLNAAILFSTATSRTLSCRSDRLSTSHTSYLEHRCLIPALWLGEDTGLGSDPPVIRAYRSFLE